MCHTVTNGKHPFYSFPFRRITHSRFSCSFVSRFAHSLTSGLDYVQSSESVDSARTVAPQINQYLIETSGPPGTIGTLGEVVIVAPQLVLTAFEFLFRRLLQAVPHGLQNDRYPAVQGSQVRFPEYRCNRIGGQRLAHSFRQ